MNSIGRLLALLALVAGCSDESGGKRTFSGVPQNRDAGGGLGPTGAGGLADQGAEPVRDAASTAPDASTATPDAATTAPDADIATPDAAGG